MTNEDKNSVPISQLHDGGLANGRLAGSERRKPR